jgi:hypothetical protein
MSDGLALFGVKPSKSELEPDRRPTPISDRQVDLLRKGLGAREVTTMTDRQADVDRAAGRPVASRRALMQEEALKALWRELAQVKAV